MKIAEVKITVLKVPLSEPIKASFGQMTHRMSALVHLATDSGITGVGETWINFPPWNYKERAATVTEGLRPLLLGEDPLRISYLWSKMYRGLLGPFRQYGCESALLQAISGADLALWDIAGKILETPVYQLLGGKFNEKIEAYASGLGPKLFPDIIESCLHKGYRAFKLKVGFGKELDESNLKTLRELIGDDSTLMIDANQAWDVQEALDRISAYEKYDLLFVEEPLPARDLAGYRELVGKSPVPIAGGENIYGKENFKQALEHNCLDIVQPDITKTGGLSEARDICSLAASWRLPYALHMFGNAVGLAATLHLATALPGGLFQETDANPNPLREELLSEALRFADGCFHLSEKPGLGVELNEDVIKEYEVPSSSL